LPAHCRSHLLFPDPPEDRVELAVADVEGEMVLSNDLPALFAIYISPPWLCPSK